MNAKQHMITVKFEASTIRDERVSSVGADMYDRVTLVSPKTGKALSLCGTWDGDTCMDIRNLAAIATNFGKNPAVKIALTVEQLHRWVDAHGQMVAHYDAHS